MTSSKLTTLLPAPFALVACLGAVGCGGGEASPQPSEQASEVRQQAETNSEGGDVSAKGGDGGDGKNGQDGEDGESVTAEGGNASQSSSVTQSGDGDQSTSIVQRSGSGGSSSSSSSGPGVKTFSGSGSTKLSFDVKEASRFAWTNAQGRAFSAEGPGLSIDSRAGRGEAVLDPRDYDDVKVRGSNWTIVIRPR